MRLSGTTSAAVREALRTAKAAVAELEVSLREAQRAEQEERKSQVQLSNRMRIAGWVGPAGWRLQTYESKKVMCACCYAQIVAGEQHVGWCAPAPLVGSKDATGDALDRYRRFAHPECLRKIAASLVHVEQHRSVHYPGMPAREYVRMYTSLKWPPGLRFEADLVHRDVRELPAWNQL